MSAGSMDGLIGTWRERAEQATAWSSGDDPEPVLDVLALTVALELTGTLAHVPSAERDALRKVGQRALLQLGGPDRDDEELEALRMCAAIARDGLRALGGKPLPDRPRSARDIRVIIPPGDLTRLLRGELDGFAAGSLALKIRRSDEAMAELRFLTRMQQPAVHVATSHTGTSVELGARDLSLAAAAAAAVLDPAGGRGLGRHPTLGVEAVLFPDEGGGARLAIYAEDPDPLRLVSPALTTEDVREGYWIGRIASATTRVEATLHVGDRSEPWVLDLEG